jgi:Flp pilus assembly protein CpaB
MSMPSNPGFPGTASGFPPPAAPAAAVPPVAAAPGADKPRKAKSPGSPRRFALLAVVVSLLAGVVILAALGGATSEDKVYVLRATQNLNVTLDVTSAEIQAAAVSAEDVEPGAITGSSAEEVIARANGTQSGTDNADWSVVGKRPRYPVFTGQQLRPEMFTTANGSVGLTLDDNERLISVSVPASNALSGALKVGDRVDIAVAAGSDFTGLVAENVEIVAIQAGDDVLRSASQQQANSTELGPNEVLPSNPIPGTYVLRVPVSRAVPVIAADATGNLYLIDRTATAGASPNAAVNIFDAVCSSPSSTSSDACAG